MDHVDPDVLALIALGEPDPVAEAHLAVCERCAEEVTALQHVVAAGRATGPDDALVAPPARVWAAIESELGLATATPPPTATGVPPVSPAAPVADTATQDGPAAATVVPLRRRRTPAWIASAAAAGVVIGGLGGAWIVGRDSDPAPAVVARAELEALPGWDAVGHAEIEEDADGRRVLVLTVDETGGAGDTDGLREVWLLKEDVSGLVSLGLLDGEEGRFLVPAGVNLSEYPVVDVSREPTDGDPAHSGDSVVRGVLAISVTPVDLA